MLAIVIFLSFAIFFSFLFLLINIEPLELVLPPVNAGKVLGISETARDNRTWSEEIGLVSALPLSQNLNDEPELKAEAINFILGQGYSAVLDVKTKKLLISEKSDIAVPIASITKLMSALVFLDYNPGWDKSYQIKAEDKVEGNRLYLFPGDTVKLHDLFYLSLVGSDNMAMMALVKATGLSQEQFVAQMDQKAQYLGLKKTNFVDPVGLNPGNVSTAYEIANLAIVAFGSFDISQATLVKSYEFTTGEGKVRVVNNTDALLSIFPQNGIAIVGGKTGFTEAAGYCFVGQFRDNVGHEVISVILGALSTKSRFAQTKELVHWTYENYLW